MTALQEEAAAEQVLQISQDMTDKYSGSLWDLTNAVIVNARLENEIEQLHQEIAKYKASIERLKYTSELLREMVRRTAQSEEQSKGGHDGE